MYKCNIIPSPCPLDLFIPSPHLLRYLYYELLGEEHRNRVHIFSSAFYNQLKDAFKDNHELRFVNLQYWTHTLIFIIDFLPLQLPLPFFSLPLLPTFPFFPLPSPSTFPPILPPPPPNLFLSPVLLQHTRQDP